MSFRCCPHTTGCSCAQLCSFHGALRTSAARPNLNHFSTCVRSTSTCCSSRLDQDRQKHGLNDDWSTQHSVFLFLPQLRLASLGGTFNMNEWLGSELGRTVCFPRLSSSKTVTGSATGTQGIPALQTFAPLREDQQLQKRSTSKKLFEPIQTQDDLQLQECEQRRAPDTFKFSSRFCNRSFLKELSR